MRIKKPIKVNFGITSVIALSIGVGITITIGGLKVSGMAYHTIERLSKNSKLSATGIAVGNLDLHKSI